MVKQLIASYKRKDGCRIAVESVQVDEHFVLDEKDYFDYLCSNNPTMKKDFEEGAEFMRKPAFTINVLVKQPDGSYCLNNK